MKIKKIKKQLNQCRSFEEFFVKVSEIKFKCLLSIKKLKKLKRSVQDYNTVYDNDAIVYLCDCIDLEIVNTMMSKKTKED